MSATAYHTIEDIQRLLPPRYKIISELGTGGESRVCKVHDSMRREEVALKIMQSAAGISSEIAKHEFRILSRLSHRNIIQVYDFGFLDDDVTYFTEEFVKGVSVTEYFDHAFTPDAFDNVIAQVCEGLAYLHQSGVMHCDLKPDNILISTSDDGSPTVKLIDFGMSHIKGHDAQSLMGTAEYISPEQIRGNAPTIKSDLYSLGIILFEIVFGSLPFRGSTLSEVMNKHLLETVPDFPPLHDVPEKITKLIKNLLVKDPASRLISAEQVKHNLLADKTSSQVDYEKRIIDLHPPLCGRENEIELFEKTITHQKDFSLIMIDGETGIGKTKFLLECRSRMQLNGYDIVWIESQSLRNKNVFDLIIALLHQSLQINRIGLSQFNELSEKIRMSEQSIAQDPIPDSTKLQRLYNQVADTLTVAHKSKSTVYFIDDIDVLDEQSKHFLETFIRVGAAQQRASVHFVFAQTKSEFITEIDEIQTAHINLQQLDENSLDKLIQSIFGSKIEPKLKDYLLKRSSGKPYDLLEYVRYFYDKNYFSFRDSGWEIQSGVEFEAIVPHTLQQLAERKIEALTQGEMEILIVLSISRIPVRGESLIQCIDGIDSDTIFECIDSLVSKRIVIIKADGYEFTNSSCKESVKSNLLKINVSTYQQRLGNLFFTSDDPLQLEESGVQLEQYGDRENSFIAYYKSAEIYFLRLRFQKCETVLQSLLKTLSSEPNIDLQEKVYSLLSKVYKTNGKYQLYLEISEELHHILREQQKEKQRAALMVQEAEIFSTMGQLDRAQRTAEKALQLSHTYELPLTRASAHVQLGVVDYHQGKYDEAIREYQNGIDLFTKYEDHKSAANTLLNAGFAATFHKSPNDGIRYFEEASSIFLKLEDDYGRARALGNLGLAYYLLGQYQRSLDVRREANKIFGSLYDKRGQANAEVSIGKVLVTMGNFGEGETHLTKALQLMREIGDTLGEAHCHENIGLLAVDTGRYEAALSAFKKAQEIARKLSHEGMLALSYQNIATVYFYQKDFESCERELSLANQLRDSIDDQDVHLNLDISRLMLLIARNKKEDADVIRTALDNVFTRITESAYESYKVWVLSQKAEYLLSQNEKYEAYASSSAAVSDVMESGFSEWQTQEMYYIHSRVCREVGKYGESREYLQKAYDEMQRKAESCTKTEMRESFLQHVPVNVMIVQEYARSLEQPKQMTDQLILNDRSLSALYKVAATINSILELEVLLPRILDLAIETLQGERGMIFLIEKGELSLQVARNVDHETIRDATEISESVLHDVVNYGKPLVVEDAQSNNEFRLRQSVRNFHITSIICVPFKLKEKIIGTIYIDRRSSFQPSDSSLTLNLQFLEAFANLAAIAVENARLHKHLKEENQYLRQQVGEQYGFGNIVGSSTEMQSMYRIMKGAMQSDSPVIIYGESGTGKELVARACHYNGLRRDKKFIAIDCGALPETLLESELFGHTKGAFTGALTDRKGLLEEADGGTVLLDEITNTNSSFQSKLLRVIQEGELRRVGETSTRYINIRIIAATNLPIEEEVTAGRFRQDLYYRLNVIQIYVPPLRNRKEDIPALVHHFITKYNSNLNKTIKGASDDLMKELLNNEWRGNVRELENTINRLMVFSDGDILTKKIYLQYFTSQEKQQQVQPKFSRMAEATLNEKSLHEIERNHILSVLQQTNGNKTEAARRLELKRTTLLKKMKKLGIIK